MLFLAETVQGLDENLKIGMEVMKNTDYPAAAITSGCELFMRFITFAKLDTTVQMLNGIFHIILISFIF